MNVYIPDFTALNATREGEPKYLLTIERPQGYGWKAEKSFSELDELIATMQVVKYPAQSLKAVEADMKAGVHHTGISVGLSEADFAFLGMQQPQ